MVLSGLCLPFILVTIGRSSVILIGWLRLQTPLQRVVLLIMQASSFVYHLPGAIWLDSSSRLGLTYLSGSPWGGKVFVMTVMSIRGFPSLFVKITPFIHVTPVIIIGVPQGVYLKVLTGIWVLGNRGSIVRPHIGLEGDGIVSLLGGVRHGSIVTVAVVSIGTIRVTVIPKPNYWKRLRLYVLVFSVIGVGFGG